VLRLLGDRGEHARRYTEEAWRVVHACAVWTIHMNRVACGKEREGSTARAMMRTCRKKVQEVAETRWRKALREGKQQAFREAWLRTGAAYMMKGRELKVHALRCAENTREQQADAGGSAEIEIYCDGAWDPESGNFTAGAAAVEFDLREAESPAPGASADATNAPESNAQLSDLDRTRNISYTKFKVVLAAATEGNAETAGEAGAPNMGSGDPGGDTRTRALNSDKND
jgi:hypothetical protein